MSSIANKDLRSASSYPNKAPDMPAKGTAASQSGQPHFIKKRIIPALPDEITLHLFREFFSPVDLVAAERTSQQVKRLSADLFDLGVDKLVPPSKRTGNGCRADWDTQIKKLDGAFLQLLKENSGPCDRL